MPVWIDRDLSPASRAGALLAVEEWNRVLNGRARFRYVGLIDVRHTEPEAKDYVESNYMSLAFVRDVFQNHEDPMLARDDAENGAIIHVVDNLPTMTAEHSRRILLHEIGHALGLHHMPGTLMAPVSSDSLPCVDRATAWVLAWQRGWDPNSLNWCRP